MAGFRDIFIKSIYRIGNYIPTKLLMAATNQKLIIPLYHIISDERVPHVQHLYQIKSVKKFIQDLDFFLKFYKPIDYFEFLEIVKRGKSTAKPSFLLTFDDGLKEFYDVIAPLLFQKGIPAICFLNSGFIDNKALFYRYKACLLIDYLENNPNLLNDYKVIEWIFDHSIGTKNVREFLLSISYQNKNSLNDFARLINYNFEEYLSNYKPYLTSDQIHSLLKQGFCFGAHSIDHPEYRFIDFDEQIKQTKESVESICAQFSLGYKTFSFPFTDYEVSKQFFDRVNAENIANITFGCAGQKKETFPNHFQRISFEMEQLTAREINNSEFLYFFIKAFLGKNTIKRK